jgi:AraC-like DNA-binding protein
MKYLAAKNKKSGVIMFCVQKKQKIINHIRDNINKELSVNALASVLAMSRFNFARKFRRSFGKPPMRYVACQRVEFVKSLLKDTDKSLSEISDLAGYSGQSHMTTAFKTVEGMTPNAYRCSIAKAVMLGGWVVPNITWLAMLAC